MSIRMLESAQRIGILVWLECSWYRQPWMQSPSWTTWKLVESGYRCTTHQIWLLVRKEENHAESIFSSISCSPSLRLYLSGKHCLLSIPIHAGLCGQLFVVRFFSMYSNASTCREVCMCENRKDTPNANGGSLSLSGVQPGQIESPRVFCPKVPILSPISMWSASKHIESPRVFCPKVPILSPISMWSASQHIGMRLQFDSVDSKHRSAQIGLTGSPDCSWLKSCTNEAR